MTSNCFHSKGSHLSLLCKRCLLAILASLEPHLQDLKSITRELILLCNATGTRDFAPEEYRLRQWLFGEFERVSHLFGFEQFETPVLESEDLFVRKAGEEITQQLYNFEASYLSSRPVIWTPHDNASSANTGIICTMESAPIATCQPSAVVGLQDAGMCSSCACLYVGAALPLRI